jgi:hypothetical protein
MNPDTKSKILTGSVIVLAAVCIAQGIIIDKDGISVYGDITQLAEKKDAHGHIISRQEIHSTLSRTFPMPGDADYQQATVDNKKDEIIITLPKRNA